MANRSMAAGITLSCAISTGQFGGCSCGGCGGLLAALDCRRLLRSASPRFRAKSIAHADTVCFSDTGICPHAQPDSHRDPEGSDQNHSQPDPDPNSDRHSNTNTPGLSRHECHTNAHACARVTLTFLPFFSFLKGIEGLSAAKAKTRQLSPAGRG